jgi:sulfur relay (sulfurtransferase) complex TusBCD TusD component (DsrE family)
MAKYLLIESRDPYDSNDTQHFYDLAQGLRKDGNDVTLFLVQNGVLPARRGAKAPALEAVAKAGVEVLADDFSLRERGIEPGELASGVRETAIGGLVDLVMRPGTKTLWH